MPSESESVRAAIHSGTCVGPLWRGYAAVCFKELVMKDEEDNLSLAARMLGAATTCDPDVERLGTLVTGSSATARQLPLVLWFDSASVFSEFLIDALPEVFCGEDDVEDLMEKLIPLADVIREEGLSQSILDELNEYLFSWIKIEWLGTFADLCAGDTEPTRLVVELFRGGEGAEPIESDEAEEFAEFLTSLHDT
jgi:hypothetical protein